MRRSMCAAVAWGAAAWMPAQPAEPNVLPRRLAGVWTENVAKSKMGKGGDLRFRRTAAGRLEELRGPEGRPVVQQVIFDGKSHQTPDSKMTIAWKQTGANRFERGLYGADQRLLFTRRLEISPDGKTLTEETEPATRSWTRPVSTAVYRRSSGGPSGLAGTWKRESFRPGRPAQMTFEPVGPNVLRVTADEFAITTHYAVTLGGPPAPITGDGVVPGMTVAAKQVDDNTIEFTTAREGVVTFKTTMRLSADGKTITSTGTPFGADGRPANEPGIRVYEKR